MYGELGDLPAPDWSLVEQRLEQAHLYWVVAVSSEWPHPRPVWGVWHQGLLCLSIGSPVIRRSMAVDGRVTVHLESATEVVVLEGTVAQDADTSAAVVRYDAKYDYAYDVARYGSLVGIAPTKVLAWTAAGVAGRDGFRSAGSWTFPQWAAPT